jgi:transcriptional repressor NrdR
MRCPNCGTLDGRVIDSRDLDDSTTIRRRRECSSCRNRYTTYERVGSARLTVLKRDGRREEFDRDKLAAGLAKALTRRPVGRDAADDAADAIEADLRSRGFNEVHSSVIGEMAVDHLRELDHIAYIRFVSVYQSFDDLEQLKREVDALYAERTERTPGQTSLHLVEDDGGMLRMGSASRRSAGPSRRRPSRRR